MTAGRRKVALAATVHDPPGALLGDVARWLPKLQRLYGRIAVASSPPTSSRLRALLAAHGADAGTPLSDRRGPLYRRALAHALVGDPERVHYLDFDRALHWVARRPTELAAMLSLAERRAVLLVGRTPRAHVSHHEALYATECEAAARFSARLGIGGRVDFLVPSFVLEAGLVERMIARSRARDSGIYGEWVALLAGLGPRLDYVECDGLDWETPDRHRREVRRIGIRAWRARMSTPAEWELRRVMATQFVQGFMRARARCPVDRVAIRRLPLGR